jgi:hypothetical protein
MKAASNARQQAAHPTKWEVRYAIRDRITRRSEPQPIRGVFLGWNLCGDYGARTLLIASEAQEVCLGLLLGFACHVGSVYATV